MSNPTRTDEGTSVHDDLIAAQTKIANLEVALNSSRLIGMALGIIIERCKVSEEDIYSKYTGDANTGPAPPYIEALKSRKEPYLWPDFLGVDTDSGASLEKLSIPGLWIFGDKDPSIPVDLSIDRLKKLGSSGHPYEYVLYPGLGHNNMEENFALATDWIRLSTTKKSE